MWNLEEDSSLSGSEGTGQQERDQAGLITPEEEVPNYRRRTTPLITCSYSSSPVKKVQFHVGGTEEDDRLGHELQTMSSDAPAPPTTTRAEKADYSGGGAAAAPLLPAIQEERSNGSNNGKKNKSPPYQHSVSMVDTVRYGATHADSPVQSFGEQVQNYNFVQLDILSGETELSNREWRETARWIKYEEDLEEGSGRWGRAHIASLSFHSLLKLRQLIERDSLVMLDLEEHDMPGIAYRVVEELSSKGLIRADESPMLMRVLLLKHRFVQEGLSWFGLKRTNTSAVSLQNLERVGSALVRRNSSMVNKTQAQASAPIDIKPPLIRSASGNYLKPGPVVAGSAPVSSLEPPPLISSNLKERRKESLAPSEEDLKWMGRRDTVIRRLIPNSGAEATLIMVGDYEGLRKPIFLFVRLSEPEYLYNVTEVPAPTRFISILLVPPSLEMDVLEVGRAFGALMSNKGFYDVAVRANGRKNLVTGINEFLDDSIVLPPGDWDNHDLLPLHVLQAKSKAIRMRKMKKQYSFIRNNDSFVDGLSLIPQDDVDKAEASGHDPFKRTGRIFGGLVQDVKKRLPFYWSDFTDAMNFQCFSTIIFMYFASIGLIITFAGLMGDKTNDLIGMSETLTATAIAGIFYSLVAGQPLIPMGPTGALLVFDEILFNFCTRYNLDFLSLRAWISVWLFLIIAIVVAAEGCVLVKWFTKFTQDIFAALTALLLIFESVDNLVEIFEQHPLAAPPDKSHFILSIRINSTSSSNYSVYEETTPSVDEEGEVSAQPNTALLSTILMLGTFFLGYFLKEFRNSVFLGEKARRALGDFGVPIAIMTMVFLDVLVTDTYTKKVKVPNGFAPSQPDERGWLINPIERMEFSEWPVWQVMLGSLGPALLLFILIFMSQQICELLINSKERHLNKGSGFHFDLLLVAIINVGSGFFGAPWLCCATVRAIGHVTALTVYSKNNPPGEKPTIVKVHEQRVTNLAVSIMVGCSVLLSPLLANIPMAVLFGVFLYMGVTSLAATQFFERFSLLFIPVEAHPPTVYVRKVRTWKMHLFTLIQILCLALLWIVKSVKAISLAFPLFFILLVPIRLQLKRFYSESELEALDGTPPKK